VEEASMKAQNTQRAQFRLLLILTLIVSFSFSGLGCGGGGGSGGAGAPDVCPVEDTTMARLETSNTEGVFADKKVILEDDEYLFGGVSAQNQISASDIELQAGLLFSVILSNTCTASGPLSSQIEQDPNRQGLRGVTSYPFELPEDMTQAELEDLAQSDACVVGMSKASLQFPTALPTDPLIPQQAHLIMLEAGRAYESFFSSESLRGGPAVIAVIDTGVDLNHEDLKGQLWRNSGEVPGNNRDDDENGYVDDAFGYNFASAKGNPNIEGGWKGNYHGTHVAGLAAAQGYNSRGVSGVMGVGARIMALNVFGADAGAFTYHTENAIRYAADNGADIINLSLGGSSTAASYREAIAYAISLGSTVLAAAGNENAQLGVSSRLTPAIYGSGLTGMLTIGSVDSSNGAWSSFSNYGANYVELAAPGSEESRSRRGLLSTMPSQKYARLQGTSMATPVASGAAGLAVMSLRARGYRPTPARLEQILRESGSVQNDLTNRVKGGKVLNLKSLSDYLQVKFPKRSDPEPGAHQKPGGGGINLCP